MLKMSSIPTTMDELVKARPVLELVQFGNSVDANFAGGLSNSASNGSILVKENRVHTARLVLNRVHKHLRVPTLR